jgi:hypothetical protein
MHGYIHFSKHTLHYNPFWSVQKASGQAAPLADMRGTGAHHDVGSLLSGNAVGYEGVDDWVVKVRIHFLE